MATVKLRLSVDGARVVERRIPAGAVPRVGDRVRGDTDLLVTVDGVIWEYDDTGADDAYMHSSATVDVYASRQRTGTVY